MQLIQLLLALCLTPSAAWHATTRVPIARSAAHISMVAWDLAPNELSWARAAWENLGLTANRLSFGDECIVVPPHMAPDQSRSVQLKALCTSILLVMLALHVKIALTPCFPLV